MVDPTPTELARLDRELHEARQEIERLKREEDHWSRECHRAAREKVEVSKQRDSALARVKELEADLAHMANEAGRDSCADYAKRYHALKSKLESAEAALQHAYSENLAFNLKVATEINEARAQRDAIESITSEAIAAWLEDYGDEPVDARIAALAIREWKWRPAIRAGRWKGK